MKRTDIVVGFDGSAPSRTALRYAALQAQRRHAPVRIVAAYDENFRPDDFGSAETVLRIMFDRSQELTDRAIEEVRAITPEVSVSGVALVGSPTRLLLDASRTAAMVVVGNRGHGGFGSLLLGSVSQRVATHADCPVVVVRGDADTADGPVIVGADGSAGSEHTLAVAFEEAARRGSGLIGVRAYHVPAPYGIMIAGTPQFNLDDLKNAEASLLEESLTPWREKYPTVRAEALAARGSAAQALVDLSSNAGLVVVGSHGHGVIAGTLLGSVTLQVLHHADCPVLVARHEPIPAERGPMPSSSR